MSRKNHLLCILILAVLIAWNPLQGITVNGLLSSGAFISLAAAPSVSGCSATIGTASGATGTLSSGTTGSCTPMVTFAAGISAPNGWVCSVNNQTTANLIRQTASSTTTATFTGVTISGDVIGFSCTGY